MTSSAVGTKGTHILCELSGCSPERLSSKDEIQSMLESAAKIASATVLFSHFHSFDDGGVSGVLLLAESHISIHTWPNDRYASLDFYTCGRADSWVALGYAARMFESEKSQFVVVERGIRIGDHFEMTVQ